jgi:regulator of sirC expression with transglutaminase-like and TPR domain
LRNLDAKAAIPDLESAIAHEPDDRIKAEMRSALTKLQAEDAKSH